MSMMGPKPPKAGSIGLDGLVALQAMLKDSRAFRRHVDELAEKTAAYQEAAREAGFANGAKRALQEAEANREKARGFIADAKAEAEAIISEAQRKASDVIDRAEAREQAAEMTLNQYQTLVNEKTQELDLREAAIKQSESKAEKAIKDANEAKAKAEQTVAEYNAKVERLKEAL